MANAAILLPVKNGAPFLATAIASVRSQTYRDWRLVILDHGSTDDSAEIAARYCERDHRISLVRHPDADGLADLLNRGLTGVDARYVVRQDADDVSRPDRLAALVEAFEDDEELVLLGSEAVTIDEAGQEIGYLNCPATHDEIAACVLFRNPMLHPATAFRLSAVMAAGAWYGKDFTKADPAATITVDGLAEDYFLFGQLALTHRCQNLRRPLIEYRRHTASESAVRRTEQILCALEISRFLARSLCARLGSEVFDPAPFCSHNEVVFDLGSDEYLEDYRKMSAAVRCWLPETSSRDRELAFRRTLATRGNLSMAVHYLALLARYGWRSEEYRLCRNWIFRSINGSYVSRLGPYR